MGNKKKETKQSEHSLSTVFVSNLPFSFTNTLLQDSFSDVGPIRRAFLVTTKGSTQHRGFGYVQFATAEDADRAIEMKNGSDLDGRKISVKHAMHRASLEQRRSKLNQADVNDAGKTVDDAEKTVNDKVNTPAAAKKSVNDKVNTPAAAKKSVNDKVNTPAAAKKSVNDKVNSPAVAKKTVNDKVNTPAAAKKTVNDKVNTLTADEKTVNDKVNAPVAAKKDEKSSSAKKIGESGQHVKKPKKLCIGLTDKDSTSDKQRGARTVVYGGLSNGDMAEEVLHRAKEIDGVCSVRYPLPKEELEQNGLYQDGCRTEAAAVVYASIRSARAAVVALHQKEVNGCSVWARQLAGEGSKTQKWKLIIRNLPFKTKASEIKEKFSAAGFVWDAFIPKKSETGTSKGFAFVKFTCKQDAEKAILKFNGQKFGNRTIAVDWAVPKKIYTTGANSVDASGDGENDIGSDDTDDDDIDLEEKAEGSDAADVDSDVSAEDKEDEPAIVDSEKELEMARKVLQNVMASSMNEALPSGDGSKQNKKNYNSDSVADFSKKPITDSRKLATKSKAEGTLKGKQSDFKSKSDEDDLPRTVFINNLPFDLDNEEVKQRFSSFGEVQAFFPVLHPITKRPRGTGFLKFVTSDAADAAVIAANAGSGLGIFLKGRQLKVLKALDKKSADNKSLEKSKNENQDQRNLYLAKEGLILEGTPAAEGVSADDLAKRQTLHQKKMSKLQSPNFHVSKTRLVIYNLPRSMTEKELRNLCIEAVTSKASKQKPMLRQVKFLNDVKKGKLKSHSRGVAFVEFAEHQHAIVALRVLNNNPETFGPQHRPIVEFAIDNVQTLRKRNLKQKDQQLQTGNDLDNVEQNEDTSTSSPNSKKERPRKRKSWDDKRPAEDREPGVEPMKGNRAATDASAIEDKWKNKKMKQNPRKADGNSKQNYENPSREEKRSDIDDESKPKKQFEKKTQNKRKGNDSYEEGNKRSRRSKNKDPVGQDVVDKLDVLIEQYKTKFSQKSSDKNEGEKQGSKQIRRWFQS